MGEAGHLVTEAASPSGNNNTTASFVTVADCQLQDGDVLWLESGKVPMPNAVSLPLYVWMPFLQQAEESVRSLADISMSKSADEVYSNRKHCYYFVGELNTTWTASMDDLYAEAMIMLQQKSNMISRDVISWNGKIQCPFSPLLIIFSYPCFYVEIAPKEMQDFLLREIRLDWLLGRSFPSSWDATAADGIVKGNTTVKKLGLKSEKSLAIEIHHIIAIPRNISRASGAFRVWIQRLMNPSSISQVSLINAETIEVLTYIESHFVHNF